MEYYDRQSVTVMVTLNNVYFNTHIIKRHAHFV